MNKACKANLSDTLNELMPVEDTTNPFTSYYLIKMMKDMGYQPLSKLADLVTLIADGRKIGEYLISVFTINENGVIYELIGAELNLEILTYSDEVTILTYSEEAQYSNKVKNSIDRKLTIGLNNIDRLYGYVENFSENLVDNLEELGAPKDSKLSNVYFHVY